MEKIIISLPKAGKARNLLATCPLMQKGGKFATDKPKAVHRRERKASKQALRAGQWD